MPPIFAFHNHGGNTTPTLIRCLAFWYTLSQNFDLKTHAALLFISVHVFNFNILCAETKSCCHQEAFLMVQKMLKVNVDNFILHAFHCERTDCFKTEERFRKFVLAEMKMSAEVGGTDNIGPPFFAQPVQGPTWNGRGLFFSFEAGSAEPYLCQFKAWDRF